MKYLLSSDLQIFDTDKFIIINNEVLCMEFDSAGRGHIYTKKIIAQSNSITEIIDELISHANNKSNDALYLYMQSLKGEIKKIPSETKLRTKDIIIRHIINLNLQKLGFDKDIYNYKTNDKVTLGDDNCV